VTLMSSGGTAPYVWSITSGTLPVGLSLGANTGIISGTPTGTGTSSFTVRVQDALSSTATTSMSVVVNSRLRITLASYNFPDSSTWPMSDWTIGNWMGFDDFTGGLPTWTAPDNINSASPLSNPNSPQLYDGKWNGPFTSYDQWVQFRYLGVTNNGGQIILQVGHGAGSDYGYILSLTFVPGSQGNNLYMTRQDNTQIASLLFAFAAGDTFRLEKQGASVLVYQNESLLTSVNDILGFGDYGSVYFRSVAACCSAANSSISFGDISVGTWGAPSISLDKSLWYFGPGNSPPPAFNLGGVAATLVANGASNGTYIWTVTSGSALLNFENGSTTITKTDVNTVGTQSMGPSTQLNDVTINLQFTPANGGQMVTLNYALTIDSPYKLVPNGSPSHAAVGGNTCVVPAPDGTLGFQSLIPYNVLSRFGKLLANINMNESFSGVWYADYVGNTWSLPSPGSFTTSTGFFVDIMCAQGFSPPALIPQIPLSSTKIQHGTQYWFVGSTTSGSGIEVQSDTFQRFQDHGEHLGIISPVGP
jgi:hypothetical protein